MSGWLSAAELADYRTCVEAGFDQTAVIQRRTDTPDPFGGVGTAYTAFGTVACRIDVLKIPVEVQIAGRPTMLCHYKVAVPASTALQGADRLTIGSQTLEVVQPATLRSEAMHHVALCAWVDSQ